MEVGLLLFSQTYLWRWHALYDLSDGECELNFGSIEVALIELPCTHGLAALTCHLKQLYIELNGIGTTNTCAWVGLQSKPDLEGSADRCEGLVACRAVELQVDASD